MLLEFLHILYAVLGLGFLVFIHELGHYFVARRVGMRVEAFGIGFGRPIYSWERDGVKWNICWLPFGGYVKIAGMEKEGDTEPEQIKDGFFGASPVNRILVALAGPIANLALALLVFGLMWGMGGREKSFSQLTQRVGWIDSNSELYERGVRPGDIITSYNDRPVSGAKDHLYAAMLNTDPVEVKGYHVDFATGERTPFTHSVKRYPNPLVRNKDILTTGVLDGASYLLYDRQANGEKTPLPEGSPMADSGLEPGDRIVWVDGERIFCLPQLINILNEQQALLTVQRGTETVSVRVPRVEISKLWFGALEKEELIDWQYEAGLAAKSIGNLFFIPYNLSYDGVVESRLAFLDKEDEKRAFPGEKPGDEVYRTLKEGDRIVAVDGHSITRSNQLFGFLQEHQVHVMVARGTDFQERVDATTAEQLFEKDVPWADVDRLAANIGVENASRSLGALTLLNPVMPKRESDFALTEEKKVALAEARAQARRRIEESAATADEKRSLLAELEKAEKRLYLGVPLQERRVIYNPHPLKAFYDVMEETLTTLHALVSGYLSAEWLSGPVGIVRVMQVNLGIDYTEALFWIGAISMNLGILNLLPIPVLDGGYIVLSLYEIVTGRRVKAKTVERLVVPFALLLIGLLLYLTFHDVSRLLGMKTL